MSESIKESVVDRYINEYYKEKINIDREEQPNFWEAVKKLCLDPNADVTNLIISNENSEYCLYSYDYSNHKYSYHISKAVKGAKNVLEAAKIIATEIINNENRKDVNVSLFLLEKRIEELEKRTNTLSAFNTVYY